MGVALSHAIRESGVVSIEMLRQISWVLRRTERKLWDRQAPTVGTED